MEPPGIHEQAAAYVLDALVDGERRQFEEHLGRCTVCKEELESLRGAAAALAYAAPMPRPPGALRGRLLEQLRARRKPAAVIPLRRRWLLPATGALAAAAACAAVGLGIWASTLSESLDREVAGRLAQQRALTIMSSVDAERYPLIGAKGVLVVTKRGEAALVVSGLPRAPKGKTYEAWVVGRDDPLPAALFSGGLDRSIVALDRRVPRGARVAVSLEREGGVPKLTGQLMFGAQTA